MLHKTPKTLTYIKSGAKTKTPLSVKMLMHLCGWPVLIKRFELVTVYFNGNNAITMLLFIKPKQYIVMLIFLCNNALKIAAIHLKQN